MAKTRETAAGAVDQQPVAVNEPATPPVVPPQAESEYTAQELCSNAVKLFSVHPDIAAAALRMAGVVQCGVERARSIIKDYTGRKLVN